MILGTKIINDLSCSNGKYDYDTENYVYCPTNTCSQCPGVEIKGISLLQLPASGISLQAEKRVETRQDLRQHSLYWKQGDLWLIRKIIILSHSETQHTGRCPLSSTRYEVAESTEVGASSAPLALPSFSSSLGFWGQTRDLMQNTEKCSSLGNAVLKLILLLCKKH